MLRTRLTLAAVVIATVTTLVAPRAALASAVVLDLRGDPLAPVSGAPLLEVQGPGTSCFGFDASTPAKYPSDSQGSFVAHLDSTRATVRAASSLGAAYTDQDDFVFGAIFTIRAQGFEADPFGFHPITFSLVNSATTGFNRTGNLNDFRSDTFDAIDVAYFAQVSPFFGGPFLSPAVFGSAVSDDAFANFAFGSTPFEFLPGATYLVTAEHNANARRLVVTAYGFGPGGLPVALSGGRVETDLSSLAGFAVDTLAITAYEDGFNIFTQSGRSLRADVEYDLLFFAPGSLGMGGSLPSIAGLIRRSGDGANGLSR